MGEINQVCISGLPDVIYTIGGGLVTIVGSSLLANFVKPDSILGKVIHFIALNFRVSKTGNAPTINQ